MTYQTVRLSDILIPKYHETFNDISYLHKIFTSGRAGTKSSRGAIRAVYKIVSDPACSVVVMRKFHNKLKKTVFKETLRAIKRLGLDKRILKLLFHLWKSNTSLMEIRFTLLEMIPLMIQKV